MVYVNLMLVVFLTTIWQILFKWRAEHLNISENKNLFFGILKTLLDPYILLGYFCSFSASILWIITLKKIPLSVAYPFLALPILIILALSNLLFNESMGLYKFVGSVMIIVGIVLIGLDFNLEGHSK